MDRYGSDPFLKAQTTPPSLLLRYGGAVVATLLATGVRFLFDPLLLDHASFVTYFVAIVWAAWYGGIGPGLTATILSSLAASYFFIEPRDSFAIANPGDLAAWIMYLISGVLVSAFSEAHWAARRRAVRGGLEAERHLREMEAVLRQRDDADRARQESEGRFRIMADSAPVMIWMARPDKLCDWFNKPWLDFTGRTLEQEIGTGWADSIYIEEVQQVLRIFEDAFDLRQPFRMEYRFRRADGVHRWVLNQGVPRYGPNGEFAGFIGTSIDITDRRTMEDALRAAGAQVRLITNAAPVGIAYIDNNQRYRFANRTYVDRHAADGEEITGKSAHEVLGRSLYALIKDHLETGLSGESIQYEASLPYPDIGARHLLISYTPDFDDQGVVKGVVAVLADISERKHAEERTRFLQEIAEGLSEAVTPDQIAAVMLGKGVQMLNANIGAVLIRNHKGDLLMMSQGPLADQIKQDIAQFPDGIPTPNQEVLESGQPIWIEDAVQYRTRYPDAAAVLLPVTGSQSLVALPLHVKGRCIGVLGFSFREPKEWNAEERGFLMSLAHQCAQALDRALLYEAEAEARREAEEANTLKLKFLAMISHELRTPLTSIKGFTSTLLAPDVSWERDHQREFIAIADQEADKLAELVEQLLDVSRLHAGTLRIEPQPERLQDIFQSAMIQLEMLAAGHVLLLPQIAGDLPVIRADRTRIAQVLTNLVGNAAKYSPPGTPIRVEAHQTDGMVQVDVSDEGEGIPPDERDTVFEAFQQVDRKSGMQSGAGLGLAICKGLIEAHGGRIWIQDRDGPGTTLSFTLPLA